MPRRVSTTMPSRGFPMVCRTRLAELEINLAVGSLTGPSSVLRCRTCTTYSNIDVVCQFR